MIQLTKKQILKLLEGDGSKNFKKILKHLMYYGQPQVFDEKDFCIYTSGEVGNYYIQSADVLKNGAIFKKSVLEICRMILNDFGSDYKSVVISGGESRDWCFSYPVACALGLPHISLYKDGKTIGAEVRGRTVIHIADLNNEGSSVRDLWLPKINQLNGNMSHVYFLIDRNEDGVKVIKELELSTNAVISFDEHTWKYLLEEKYITKKQYNSIKLRLADKDSWARRVLEENPERVKALWEKEPKKMEKVVKAYPELSEYLINLKNS